MDVVNIESPVEKYILTSEDEKKDLINRIMNDLDSVYYVFRDKAETAMRNIDYYAGRQWDSKEILAHEKQNRKPYVFNEVQRTVDHLIGVQTQTRMDSRVLPRERGDEAAALLLNYLVKWAEQVNDIEYVETTVFKDAIIKGLGACVIRWDLEDVEYGYPAIEKIPMNELYMDLNFTKLDLSDCRWVARVQYMYKEHILEIFPDKQQLIETSTPLPQWGFVGRNENVLTNKQENWNNYRGMSYSTDNRDLIEVVEYYERKKIYTYLVIDGEGNETYKFDLQSDAEDWYRGLVDGYTAEGKTLVLSDGTPSVQLQTNAVDGIFQTIVCGEQVIEHTLLDIPFFPFTVCFGYFDEGDYWAFVDNLVSPQDLVNRSFSQWDYQIGTSTKGALTVMESLLKRGFTIEDVRREIAKTSPVVPVLNHGAISQIPNSQIQKELMENISFAITRINDYAGGKNVLGLQENAAESGRAVIARAEQGGIAKLPLFDNLRYWRKQLTFKLVWFIKNLMPAGEVLSITGQDKDLVYVELDDGVLDSIKELKVNVIIDEANQSETAKQRDFQQLMEMFSRTSFPPDIMQSMMIEYSNLPETRKEELRSRLDFEKQYQQQQAQVSMQQKMEQEVAYALQKKKLRDQMEMQDQLDEQSAEVDKNVKNLKMKLSDIEELKLAMKDNNLSTSEKNDMFNKLQDAQELGARQAATTS